MARNLHREEYTVGWICALPVELAAAQEMLDEVHGPPKRFEHDDNLYHLGSISGHNVVIVCLPAGQIGNNPAVAVVTQARATFQGIQFGLMVGIGGGVPSAQSDIRLGDVVISQPNDVFGGVVQYDSGKATLGGFRRTGSLNSPPQILLASVASLRANELRGKSRISKHIAKLDRNPKFRRDRTGPDVLFKSEYTHEGGETCDVCRKDQQITRHQREEDMFIHYGTVASGNQVIKNALERDSISAQLGGVLCFEMEAAGLMNTFPCLVVRGICDYADSHKNKSWQAYAAGTAAACGKEILTLITPTDAVKPKSEPVFTAEDLDCIKHLCITDPRHDKTRIEANKGGLLVKSYSWILQNCDFQQWRNNQETQLLWVKGDPGKGKTMLLCGIIDEINESKTEIELLSFFFCQNTDSRINNSTSVIRGLLYMLVNQQPSLISHIRKQYDVRGKALFEDANAWVALCEIFTDILQDSQLNETYLVIDALDELVDLPKMLEFLVQSISLSNSNVKWIVSSRNWPMAEEQLEQMERKARLSLELNAASVSAAVDAFIEHKVHHLAQEMKYNRMTEDALLDFLKTNADDTFLWVALVCQDLKRVARRNVLRRMTSFPPGLDALYQSMMQQVSISDDADVCKQILALAATAYRPLTLPELAALFEEDVIEFEDLEEIIAFCGSFLILRHNTVFFVHQSAKDFLIAKATNEVFPSGSAKVHSHIFQRSLTIMSSSLERDMYNLKEFGYSIEDFEELAPQSDPLASSRYSCIYWINHLCDGNPDPSCAGNVESFLKEKFLYWLEALSLNKSIPLGIMLITTLERTIQEKFDCAALYEFVQDARRFALTHKWVIENHPLQIYMSALIFSPTRSLIRHFFRKEEPDWIRLKPPMEEGWSNCLQTLEAQDGGFCSIAVSHDSTWLASASYEGLIRIWDISNGSCLRVLKGHYSRVTHLALAPDSTWLASASDDGEVKTWDVNTGSCLHTFREDDGWFGSLACFSNSARLAICSRGVRVWDPSHSSVKPLDGPLHDIRCTAFSQDGLWLASASNVNLIRIWDISSGKCLKVLEEQYGKIVCLTFSPDKRYLASGSDLDDANIWDTRSGIYIHTFMNTQKQKGSIIFGIESLAFSHDSSRLAVGTSDHMIRIWDVNSGKCLQEFRGHGSSITWMTFTHNSTRLVSASWDETIKIWDASSVTLQSSNILEYDIVRVIFCPIMKWMASVSQYRQIKLWDVNTGECVCTVDTDGVPQLAFSHNSAWLAAAGISIEIWDIKFGNSFQKIEGHDDSVHSLEFTHNSSMLVSGSYDYTIKIWDTASGNCLQTLQGAGHMRITPDLAWLICESSIYNVDDGNSIWTLLNDSRGALLTVLSHDKTLLAISQRDTKIMIRGIKTANCIQPFTISDNELETPGVKCMAFSHDSTWLASACADFTVRIWDVASGTCLKTLETDWIMLQISVDTTGQYLCTDKGNIDIGPLSSSEENDRYPQMCRFKGLAMSDDTKWITYNSKEVLWLPSEYRLMSIGRHWPSLIPLRVSGRYIGAGYGNGRVWICEVQPDLLDTEILARQAGL